MKVVNRPAALGAILFDEKKMPAPRMLPVEARDGW